MEKKKYFAFISYKREDEEWAKWFQNELENYHLPSTLNGKTDIINELPEQFRPPKGFRPVFRDIDELKAGNLPEQIYKALKDSLNLVVICSSKLADDEKAKWVNKEISDFIVIGAKEGVDNVKHIFPFIVDGIPHAADRRECFPKVLRELSKEQERIGGNVNEGGDVSEINRERAFVKVLAGMLSNVDFDKLWNRYDRDKMERERREKEKRDKLLIAQSRFLAEKAHDLIESGDSYLASLLSLKALPTSINDPNRPYVVEAEAALRKSTKKDNAFLLGHKQSVISSVFNNDGSRIYSVSWDKKVWVWDSMSGRTISTKQKHTAKINSIVLNKDGSLLATASSDHRVIIWDAKSLKQKGKSITYDTAVKYASFSPNGDYLLAALDDGTACISDIKGNLICRYDENSKYDIKSVFHILMLEDSQIITSSYEGVKVWSWDKNTTQISEIKHLNTGDRSEVRDIKYCPQNNYLIFAQGENLYLWDITVYEFLKNIPFPTQITAIVVDEEVENVMVACYNCLYLLAIPKDGKSWGKTKSIAKFEHGISHLAFHPRKRSLLISFNTGPIHLIDFGGNSSIQETKINADSLSFISNNRLVVASSHEVQPCVIYDIKKATRETIIPEDVLLKNKIHDGISYDDFNEALYYKKKIYSLSEREIHSFSTIGNASLRDNNCTVSLSNYKCCFKTISSNGKQAIFAYKDGTMFLIDAYSGKVIKMIERTRNHTLVHSAYFSRDSKYIATTSEEGVNRLYSAKDGSFIQKLPLPFPHPGNSIEFSNKGDMILCASQDYNIYIWKKDEEKKRFYLKKTLAGHEERVCCASFNSDGKLVVSSSPSKLIVWDVESGIPIEVIKMKIKEHGLNFVKFSPDDTRIFVSREGKLVIVEFPKLQKLITTTRERFKKRKLTLEEKKKYYLE